MSFHGVSYLSISIRMTEVGMKDVRGQVTFLRKELSPLDGGGKEKRQVGFLRKELKEERGKVVVLREELWLGCESA